MKVFTTKSHMRNIGYSAELRKIISEENKNWTRIFEAELSQKSHPKYSSEWWKNYYDEITKYVRSNILIKYNNVEILEPGSGSGKASILLGEKINITLLDISSAALKYAKVLAERFGAEKIKYVQGDIFSLPFKGSSFDFVWNIGVIEHYEEREIVKIISEMLRVTRNNGTVSIAFPNFSSGPIIKARILKNSIFKNIKGYRIGTEKFYDTNKIISLVKSAAKNHKFMIRDISVNYFGNPLPMETPTWFLNTVGRILHRIAYRRRFLIMIAFEVGK